MLERVHFLVVYVGSAAMAAYLAALLSSPQIANFGCDGSDVQDVQRCELAATLAAMAPEAGAINLDALAVTPERVSAESGVTAGAQ